MQYYNLRSGESFTIPPGGVMPGTATSRLRGRAVALGNFDGFHAGHAELARRLRARAAEFSEPPETGIWSFNTPTKDFLNKSPVAHLNTTEDKLALFAAAGLDFAVLEDFERVRGCTPEQFAEKILIGECGVKLAVCGFDFRFGAGRAGDAELLRSLLAGHGAETIIVPPVFRCGHIVSSTAIRFYIENGEMELAREMLGRPFSINFPVIAGRKLGRSIGLPTINQDFPPRHIIPQRGIYACSCEVGEDIFIGVSNVGVRPTVAALIDGNPADGGTCEARVNCETHIINYNGWLYGKNIRVSFYRRLRDEMKFASIEELRAAINGDIAAAADYFGGLEKI